MSIMIVPATQLIKVLFPIDILPLLLRRLFHDLIDDIAQEFDLHINLNLGKSKAVIYTCDLTEEYVDFNKGDVSNPAALGG